MVGAVFEGIGVSTGSYIGGMLMESVQGSQTFRIFSYGAFIFFALHVSVQWLLTKIDGPYGKKSNVHISTDEGDKRSNEALDVNNEVGKKDVVDDGFKEIDLTR